MTQTLTRTGIVVPSADNSDPFDPVTYIRNVGSWLETRGVWYSQGILASRPTPGTVGRWYKPTDTGSESLIYWDDGTAWQTIGAGAPTDGSAATPSLRTLGSGATQAAAGNHTHSIGAIIGAGTAASAALGAANGAASLDSSGQVPASQLGNASIAPTYVYKATDTSRTTTGTATADPHLTATLAAGTWQVTVELAFTGSTAGDLLVDWTFGGTATTRLAGLHGPALPVADPTDTNMTAAALTGPGSGWAVGATTVAAYALMRLVLVVTASGTFAVAWGQSSPSGTTVVKAGSHLIATKLA